MRRSSTQSQILALRARQLRSHLTPSEQALWSHINAGQLGVWFRRQVPVGNFIADFAAPSVRLVIEVDGGYHSARRAADARRDRKLARLGYRVVRIDAALITAECSSSHRPDSRLTLMSRQERAGAVCARRGEGAGATKNVDEAHSRPDRAAA